MNSQLRALYNSATLVDLLRSHAQFEVAGKIAIRVLRDQAQTTFTYQELVARALKAGQSLAQQTKRGDRIILAMPTSAEFVEWFLACLFTGRIAVPVPIEKATSRYSRLTSVVGDCKPELALFRSPEDLEKMKAGLGNVEAMLVSELGMGHSAPSAEQESISGDTVAFIQYTSGSTSDPKGVVLTHRNLISNVRMIQQGMQITPEDRIFSWLPVHHDMGLVGMMMTPIGVGAETSLLPYQEFAREPMSWLEFASRLEATITGAPTFAFNLVGHKAERFQGQLNLSALRLVYCGSERISLPVTEHFFKALAPHGLRSSAFFPCYGMAEASLYVSGGFRDAQRLSSPECSWQGYPSCGNVAHGLALRVVDTEGTQLPPGEVGEIEICGASVSPGYWKDISAQVVEGIFRGGPDQWLKTGDLGCLNGPDVIVTGRLKDLIKIRGRNIYPDDLESPIEGLTDWFSPNSVVTVGSSDSAGQESITVIAEINRSQRAGAFSDLNEQVQAVLNEHDLRASRLVVVSPSSLPKTSSGKKQRQRTAALLAAGQLKVVWDSASEASGGQRCAEMLNAIIQYAGHVDLTAADERRDFPKDFVASVHKFKFTGLLIPKEFGGQGLSHSEFAEIGRGLGAVDLSIGAMIGNHNTIGVLPILHSPRLADKAFVLKEVTEKGAITAFALTEPEAGSNPRAIQSEVDRVNGKLILNGEKIWIGNAGIAEFISVFAKEFDDSGKEIGISAFLLRRSKHGFRVGPGQLTLGLKPMLQNQVYFDNVEIDEMDRLTPAGQGLPLAFLAMEYARFGLAALATGAMDRVLKKTEEYALTRSIWTGLLAKNDYFKLRFHMAKVKMKALEAFTMYTAGRISSGAQIPQSLSLICKILAGEWSGEVADFGLQSMGGRGYTENYGMARIWRDARVIRIFEGPTETVAFQLGSNILRNSEKFIQEVGTLSSQDLLNAVQEWQQRYGRMPIAALAVHVGLFAAQYIAISGYQQSIKSDAHQSDMMNQWLRTLISETSQRLAMSHVLGGNLEEQRQAPPPPAPAAKEGPAAPKEKSATPPSQVPSEAQIAEKLAGWLKSFTRVQHVDVSRSLAAYGVDSLLAYELMCFIEEEFDVTLPESVILEKPSLAEIQARILSAKKTTKKNEGQTA